MQPISYGSAGSFGKDYGLYKILNLNPDIVNQLTRGENVEVNWNGSNIILLSSNGLMEKMATIAKTVNEKLAENIPVICRVRYPTGYRQIKDRFELTFYADTRLPQNPKATELANIDKVLDSTLPFFQQKCIIESIPIFFRET